MTSRCNDEDVDGNDPSWLATNERDGLDRESYPRRKANEIETATTTATTTSSNSMSVVGTWRFVSVAASSH